MNKAILLFVLAIAGVTCAQASTHQFKTAKCPFDVPEETQGLRCGYLQVPENRDDPEGRTLRIAVAVLESLSDSPEPDPLVFLSGGPGGPAIKDTVRRLNSPFWTRFRQNRDLVFYDQRGTGFSDPKFCPELDVALYTTQLRGLTVVERQRIELEAVRQCREQILVKGIDLAHYNSISSAHDLADLRLALGYKQWNLFGVSYGTRLALTALREAPEGIRSVILDSVLAPNSPTANDHERLARSLRLVFEACATDSTCVAVFPELEQSFYTMLEGLEARPLVLEMGDAQRFPGGRLVVDGTLMAAGIYQGLYSEKFVEVFPLVVREVGARNVHVITALADGLVNDPGYVSHGLFLAVDCFEHSMRASPEAIAADRAAHPELGVWTEAWHQDAICQAWHPHRAEPFDAMPVYSDVPALLLSGSFDPATPPANARLAANSLANSTLVEVRTGGHGVTPFFACTRDLSLAFLSNPALPLDTTCVDQTGPPRFKIDVRLVPGIGRLVAQYRASPPYLALLGLFLATALLVSTLVAWPAGWLRHRLRGLHLAEPIQARRARWLAACMALMILVFLIALGITALGVLKDNPFLLVFGVPANAGWFFVLPWLAGLASLVVAGNAANSWRREWWGPARRTYYTMVALAGLGLSGWIIIAGLAG